METKKQKTTLAESYLTVAEAAEQLGVHQSTIRRWIDSGLLRAYRFGQKRIGVKVSDLGHVVARHGGQKDGDPKKGHGMKIVDRVPTRLTKEEQERGLRALANLQRRSAELVARYGKPDVESWVLINEARDERTRQLMEAIEGRQE